MKAVTGTKDIHRQLRRIVALLLAFADLSERAAGRSGLVRLLAVWFLRQAEGLARHHVLALTGRVACRPAQPDGADAEAEALSIAARFRALAMALAAFANAIMVSGMAAVARALPALAGAATALAAISCAVARLDTS